MPLSIVAESGADFHLVKTMLFFILKKFYLFKFSPQIYYFGFKKQFTKMLKNNDLDKPGHYELQKVINVKTIFIFRVTVR